MNATRAVAAVIAVLIIGISLGYLFFGNTTVQGQTQGASDLVVGTIYEVADFRPCQLINGATATEWHFGGADRSLRNQLTPRFDGRGRRIFRVVKNDPSLPASHMRLRKVSEADPTLEGFSYGTYVWEGIVVQYNGRVERQQSIGPCGPAR